MRKFLLSACLAAAAFAAYAAQAAELKAPAGHPPYFSLADLRAKYADSESKFFKVNGVEVHYKDEGKGPAILMIHGSSSSLKTYDVIAATLKDRYRIIRFDVPTQGLSGLVSDAQASSMDPTDIPRELLKVLGVKSTACVGVSSGSTMCAYLAGRNPGLVNHLILSNGPADPLPIPPPPTAEEKARAAIPRTRASWDTFFSRQAAVPERITPAIRDTYYEMNHRAPDKNIIALAAKVEKNEVAVDLMGRVTAPVLLLWGAKDRMLPMAAADTLETYLKNAQVSKLALPDAGHYPPLEIPERYAQIIATYLEAVAPTTAASAAK